MKSFESKNWKLIRKIFLDFISRHQQYNGKVFVIGGAVRDSLLKPNYNPNDFDIIVESPGGAKDLASLLHQQNPLTTSAPYEKGRGYPTWSMMYLDDSSSIDNINLDISDTQKEAFPDPQTRQRITSFGTRHEDILRRDFTINSMSYDLTTEDISPDTLPYLEDLNHKKLRHHQEVLADQMFSDDPLRMLRALRFCSTHQFTIHPQTLNSLILNFKRLDIVSTERKYSELQKIVTLSGWNRFLQLSLEWGVFSYLFPHLDPSKIHLSSHTADDLFEMFCLSFYENDYNSLKNTLLDYKFPKRSTQDLKAIHSCIFEIQKLPQNDWKIRNILRKNHNFINFLRLIPELIEKTKDIHFDKQSIKGQLPPFELIQIFQLKGEQIQQTYNYTLEIEDKFFSENNKIIPQSLLLEKTKDYVTKNFT